MKPLYAILLLALFVTFASPAVAGPVPTWDKQLKGRARFQVLKAFAGAAVLDKETGLVWEKSPSADTFTWGFALFHCVTLAVGGRAGWRLPGISELLSLVDPSVPSPGPTLPDGHPFTNVQIGVGKVYWTASNGPFSTGATFAWEMNFVSGVQGVTTTDKSSALLAWCVRGGDGVDPQT